jgi:hypothetical protein
VTVGQPLNDTAPRAVVTAYLEALTQGDVARCVDMYAADGCIHWPAGRVFGRANLEHWHQQRFAARLRVTEVRSMRVDESRVTVAITVTSGLLASARIPHLALRAILLVEGGRINDLSFGLTL